MTVNEGKGKKRKDMAGAGGWREETATVGIATAIGANAVVTLADRGVRPFVRAKVFP